MSVDDKPASGLDATLSAVGAGSATRAEPTRPNGADVPLAPGATLGRYVLVEALGAGGMGMVFRARDPDLGREVAIKVLRADDGSGGGLERRLLREAQAMATVSHDNLANVFDIGTTGGRVFIAMELVDGGTLRALFADATKTWRDKLAAVTAAGRGLAAAHSAGVIHRDFKPDNVLIAKNGRVKVVDFGLARADRGADVVETASGKSGRADGALPADLSAQLTQTGALLGTPAYMAPEQHAGELVDARSDQFGFAVTAWEAVYGGRPFVSDAYSSLVSAVRSHQITPPPKGAGVPAALEAALRRALSPAPTDRFSSMDALLDAIDRAIRPRGRRTALIAASAGAILVGGGIAMYSFVTGGAATTPPTAAKPTVKNKLGDGSATQVRVTVIPFDLTNLDEFQRGSGDRGEAAIERMVMKQALDSHGEEIGACYQEAGVDRAGRVSIEFTVRPDGRVASYRTTEDNFPETGIASCVGAKAMLWSFPPANNGETRVVTFPFQFSPGESGEDGEREGFPFDPNVQIDIPGLVGMAARLAGGIDEVGDNHYALSRELATEIANDPELASSARIEPVMRGRKQVGYQLFAIREDSAFEQLGLADGDIVESINGTALTSRAAADRAIAAAKTASRVELQVRRDGKRVAVSIDVLPAGEMHAFPIPPMPAPPTPPAPAPGPGPAPAP